MYLADSIGYLGYALVLSTKSALKNQESILPSFTWMLYISSAISILALIFATRYFQNVLGENKSAADPKLTSESGGHQL